MLILLSDGAGLTSRQCATVLSRAGHQVEALSAEGLCLCRMTRHVRRVHHVPGIGADPFGWLDAALEVAARRHAEVLLPVQEQVAVMALARDRIEAAGLLTAVPDFAALARVQDKVSAFGTLAQAGVPQPAAVVVTSGADLEAAGDLPAFVKTPIGTASAGVCQVRTRAELQRLAARWERDGVFGAGGVFGADGVLVQQPADGPLAMVQSVFCRGELVAFHACQRVREGTSGGASHKLGLDLPEAREHLAALGGALGWHGALSADVIVTRTGVQFIDINEGRAGQRAGLRRRPDASHARGRAHRHVAAAAARTARRADPPAGAGGAGRGAARRPPRDRQGAGERAVPARRLPGQPGRTHPRRRRPARRGPGRGDRRGHPGAPGQLAAFHRRQRRRLRTDPGGLAGAHHGRRRAGACPGAVALGRGARTTARSG
jgi:hypothetical protein